MPVFCGVNSVAILLHYTLLLFTIAEKIRKAFRTKKHCFGQQCRFCDHV